jgi:hypothetical protein
MLVGRRFDSPVDDQQAPLSIPRPAQPEGKIFVGGLNWITTTESLKAHFERFGAIADCVIMKVCCTAILSVRNNMCLACFFFSMAGVDGPPAVNDANRPSLAFAGSQHPAA